MKIISCVDFMATSFGSTEEEYAEIESEMRDVFPDVELEFEREDVPGEIAKHKYDLCVFDWGGLLPGAEDLTRSIYRSMLSQVRKFENDRLFIMWSAFTEDYFKEAAEEEFPEFIAPNVIFRQDTHLIERARKFFGLGELP